MNTPNKKLARIVLLVLFLGVAVVAASKVDTAWSKVGEDDALIAALKNNDQSAAEAALEQGADANASDVGVSSQSVRKRFWDNLAGRKQPVKGGQPALLIAIKGTAEKPMVGDCAPLVKALIEHGADVNTKDAAGNTALMAAIEYGHLLTAQVLLEHGADANLRQNDRVETRNTLGQNVTTHINGRTALEYASDSDNAPATQLLLKYGAKADARDAAGQTVLMWAAGAGKIEKLRAILDAGGDVNAKDKAGSTPMMLAAINGYSDVVTLLISKRANVNAQDRDGDPALMYCVGPGNDRPKTLQVLLKAGADPNIKNAKGETTLRVARKHQCAASVRLLEQAGAKE